MFLASAFFIGHFADPIVPRLKSQHSPKGKTQSLTRGEMHYIQNNYLRFLTDTDTWETCVEIDTKVMGYDRRSWIKPQKLPLPRKTVNQKQYHILRGIVDISVTIMDVKVVRSVDSHHIPVRITYPVCSKDRWILENYGGLLSTSLHGDSYCSFFKCDFNDGAN